MDILDDELLKFWRSLNKNQVKYIMVGGFATRFHGFNRSTDDLDLWLDNTPVNRVNLRKSFVDLGYGDFPSLETMVFVPGWTSFYVGQMIELDIMTEMKGLDGHTFDECLDMASIADLDGTQVPFLHINQLIANKKAVNRPKDQIDVLELERIKTLRDEANKKSR
jgi:predicted nucleotidyltransferase